MLLDVKMYWNKDFELLEVGEKRVFIVKMSIFWDEHKAKAYLNAKYNKIECKLGKLHQSPKLGEIGPISQVGEVIGGLILYNKSS